MSFKTTYILFGVLIAMLCLFGAMLAFTKTSTDSGYLFPSFHTEKAPLGIQDITSVIIRRKGREPVFFARRGQEWFQQNPEIRLTGYEVNLLLREITDARREEETDVTPNLRLWGLEDPPLEVTLKKGTQREWKLKVGRQSPESEGVVYVSSSDRPGEVLAVKKANLSALVNFDPDKYWSRKLLEANTFLTRSLEIRAGATKIVLRKDARGNFFFAEPPYGPAETEGGLFFLGTGPQKQSPGVRGLLEAIDKIEAQGMERLGKNDFRWYGVQDGAPGLRITVENTRSGGLGDEGKAGPTRNTLLIGHRVKGTAGDKAEYYARLLSDPVVVRVTAKSLETVREVEKEKGERLRSLRLEQIQPMQPDAVTVRNRSGPIELRRGREGWKVKSPATGVQKADDVEIHDLLTALSADHQVKQFLDRARDADLGISDSSPSVSVWVGGVAEEKPPAPDPKKAAKEKKPADDFPALKKAAAGKPAVKLVFGKSAGGLVYVKREADGEVTRVAVPDSLLGKVDRDALGFLHHNLSPFSTADVTRLVLTRKGQTYDVSREANGKGWKLKGAGGARAADADQVNAVLLTLTRLQVERWVKVKPTPDDLKSYGLDKPAVRAEVTVKVPATGKPQTRVYSFSKEQKDPATGQPAVYGRLTGTGLGAEGDLVFRVVPAVVQVLRDAELRDRTVFRFDPSRVRKVVLDGWNDPAKRDFRITPPLELVREGNRPWKLSAGPEGFKLDEQKVPQFVLALSNLKLYQFVPGGPKKDYRLGRKESTLTVEITLDGEKEPLWLVVGRQKGKEPHYYARSSTLGQEVFLVPQQELAPVLGTQSWISFFRKTGG